MNNQTGFVFNDILPTDIALAIDTFHLFPIYRSTSSLIRQASSFETSEWGGRLEFHLEAKFQTRPPLKLTVLLVEIAVVCLCQISAISS